MILYHGCLVVVETPQILVREAGRGADFGTGFYTTSSYGQAVRWVRVRQKGQETPGAGYVSFYEVPDDLMRLQELHTRRFQAANAAWLHFVRENRSNPRFEHAYDVVQGPVANDRVYATLNLWEGGFLNDKQTILQLKTFKLVDQYLFHTEKALEYLRFLKAKEIQP